MSEPSVPVSKLVDALKWQSVIHRRDFDDCECKPCTGCPACTPQVEGQNE